MSKNKEEYLCEALNLHIRPPHKTTTQLHNIWPCFYMIIIYAWWLYLCVGSRAPLPAGEHISEGKRFWPLKDEVGLRWASWVHLWEYREKSSHCFSALQQQATLSFLSHLCWKASSYLCSTAAPSAWHTSSRYASSSRPTPSSPSAQADPFATGRPPDGCRAGTRLADRQER